MRHNKSGEEAMQIGVHKVTMAAPNDVSELAKLLDAGTVNPNEIVALIGKTEGNGGANDFTRGFATSSYQTLLAKHLKVSPEEVGQRIAMAIEVTRDIAPEEVGTMAQVREVADATRRCLARTAITDPNDVHYVQVKGPLLTPASISDADRRGKTLRTRDPNGS